MLIQADFRITWTTGTKIRRILPDEQPRRRHATIRTSASPKASGKQAPPGETYHFKDTGASRRHGAHYFEELDAVTTGEYVRHHESITGGMNVCQSTLAQNKQAPARKQAFSVMTIRIVDIDGANCLVSINDRLNVVTWRRRSAIRSKAYQNHRFKLHDFRAETPFLSQVAQPGPSKMSPHRLPGTVPAWWLRDCMLRLPN